MEEVEEVKEVKDEEWGLPCCGGKRVPSQFTR